MLRPFAGPIGALFILILLTPSSASAEQLSEQLITDTASPLVEDEVVKGISIGYLQGDSWGIVHLGNATPSGKKADNRTMYELGSLSKLFTSTLLADFVIAGDIEIEADVQVENDAGIRLPSHEGRSITWRDLATHRSGLPRIPANLEAQSLKDPYRNYDSSKAADALAVLELTRKPGEAQEYSNFAMSVLGYLIAAQAGKPYQELLRQRIADPLGMSDCTVELTAEQKKRFAIPHQTFDSPTLAWSFADMPGAGGVRASMRDMMRFAKAQLQPPSGHLGEAIELVWKQQSDADATGPATGLGWMIAADGETRWLNGATGGSRVSFFVNRRIKTAVIVLCNTAVSDQVDEMATHFIRVAAGVTDATVPVADAGSSMASDARAPKVSPFTSVGLNNEMIFVAYQGKILRWLEIDGINVEDIIESAKKQFDDQWGKRVREDLVEVLWGMGHRPGETVALRMQDFNSKEEVLVTDAKMTTENRRKIKAESKTLAGNPVVGDPVVGDPIVGDFQEPAVVNANHRARLVGRYQLAPNFIFDVKDRGGRMMVGITNQPTQEVFADSPTHWSYRGVNATLEFKLNATGPAKSLVLHQNGTKQNAKRIE